MFKGIGLSELSLSSGYSVINYNGEAVYLEGVSRLLSIEEDEIRLELRGAIASVGGVGLHISELSGGCIIKGEIVSLNFEKRRRKNVKAIK